MKKRSWFWKGAVFFLLFGLCLFGCGRETKAPNQEGATEGYENYFLYSFTSGQFLESRDSYYMIYLSAPGGYGIYTLDKENPTAWLPLCGRPDCPHNDQDCNCKISNPSAMGLYQDHLYFLGSQNGNTQLWRMELDGSNHELVKELFPYSTEEVPSLPLFHKGYVLYEVQHMENGQIAGCELRCFSLDPDEKEYQVIRKEEGEASFGCYPWEDRVFIYTRSPGGVGLSAYNLDSKTLTELEKDAKEPVSITIQKDRLWLSLRQEGVYRMELPEGTKEKIAGWGGEEEGVYTDEDYLYRGKLNRVWARQKEAGGTIQILDLEGNPVAKGELPEEVLYYTCSTSRHIFFHRIKDMETQLPSYYLDKEEVKEGKLVFYRLQ